LDDPVAALAVGEWLVAPSEVDDRETARRHPDSSVEIEAGPVGAAVSKLARHRQKKLPRRSCCAALIDAHDSAHPASP
jgi:hypothetical protein